MSFHRLSFSGLLPKQKGYSTELKTVGDHIRRKRMDEELTLSEVGGIIGVNNNTLTSWSLHDVYPMIRHFPGIIKYLGYAPLFFDDGSLSSQMEHYRRVNGLSYKKLSKLIGCDEARLKRLGNKHRIFQQSIDKIEQFLKGVSH